MSASQPASQPASQRVNWGDREERATGKIVTSGDAGYSDAFVDLVRIADRVAYRVGYRVLGSAPEAEHVAQETLTRALVRWSKVQSYAPAWMAIAAFNLAVNSARPCVSGRTTN